MFHLYACQCATIERRLNDAPKDLSASFFTAFRCPVARVPVHQCFG
jgi:hypothetical protein